MTNGVLQFWQIFVSDSITDILELYRPIRKLDVTECVLQKRRRLSGGYFFAGHAPMDRNEIAGRKLLDIIGCLKLPVYFLLHLVAQIEFAVRIK